MATAGTGFLVAGLSPTLPMSAGFEAEDAPSTGRVAAGESGCLSCDGRGTAVDSVCGDATFDDGGGTATAGASVVTFAGTGLAGAGVSVETAAAGSRGTTGGGTAVGCAGG